MICRFDAFRNCGGEAEARVLLTGQPGPDQAICLCAKCVEEYSAAIETILSPVDPRDIPDGYRSTDLNRWMDKIHWDLIEDIENDCWMWTAACKVEENGGHAWFWDRTEEQMISAHQWTWQYFFGTDPPASEDDLEIMHSCSEPTCQNPQHLWLGTHSQNAQHSYQEGDGNRSLTDAEAKKIIEEYQATNKSVYDLADEYGVGKEAVHRAVTGKSSCYARLH